MEVRCFEMGMAVLLLLASATLASWNKAEQLLPEVIVDWEKAGATSGWMGLKSFVISVFHNGANGLTDEVPGFRFNSWENGIGAKLPVPAALFGLQLYYPKVTDVGMKELVDLKNLYALDLFRTKVTSAARA